MLHARRQQRPVNRRGSRQTALNDAPRLHRPAVPFVPRSAAEAAEALILAAIHLPRAHGSMLGQLQACNVRSARAKGCESGQTHAE